MLFGCATYVASLGIWQETAQNVSRALSKKPQVALLAQLHALLV